MLTYSELSYIEAPLPKEQCIVGMPLGTRCHRIERVGGGWRVWIATSGDFIHGTWLDLCDNGRVVRTTTRSDEGDEFYLVRPSDNEIRRKL